MKHNQHPTRLTQMAGFILFVASSVCAAPLGTTFAYQGRLNDGAGPANGIYALRFALYDAVSGPTQMGSALTNAVTVSNGLFTVLLDFGPGAFSGDARWLEIGVRTNGSPADFTLLVPRQPLTPAPYALSAASVPGGAITSPMLASGAVTATKIAPGAVSQLGTPNGSGTGVVQVANSGLVGLGTNSPQAGLHITTGREILTPTFLAELVDGQGSWSNLAGTCGVAASGDLLAVASYTDDALTLLSISNPAAPVFLWSARDGSGVFTNLNGATALAFGGSLLAVAGTLDDAVTLVDVSNPAAPIRRSVMRDGVGGFNDLNGAFALDLTDGLLAVAAPSDHAVSLVDVKNPASPVLVGLMKDGFNGFTALSNANALARQGSLLAIAASGDNAVTVADIRDPSNPILVATIRHGVGRFTSLTGPVGLAWSANLLAIAAYGDNAVTLVDMRDPSRPVWLATMNDGAGGFDHLAGWCGLLFQGSTLWIAADGDSALTAVDVSETTAPVIKTVLQNGRLGFNRLTQVRSLALSGSTVAAAAASAVTLLNGASSQQVGMVSEGWVGIGVPQPAAPLHVAGNVIVQGGSVVADSFEGDGARLTNLDAARLNGLSPSTGAVPNTVAIRDATGSFSVSNLYVANLKLSENVSTSIPILGMLAKFSNNFVATVDAATLAEFQAYACGSNNAGPTCASPESIGQIGWGGSTSRTGALPAGGSAEHWYRVSWSNSGASYHPHVYLSAGAAYYTIDVILNCAGSALAIGDPNWETTSQTTLAPGTQVYVRVRPYTANPACHAFTVVFVNG